MCAGKLSRLAGAVMAPTITGSLEQLGGVMRLRAQILIEVDAEDFVAAANHERAIQAAFKNLQLEYGSAQLELREVRTKTPKDGATALNKMRRYTGNLNQYAD